MAKSVEELESELEQMRNQQRAVTRELSAWRRVGREAGDLIDYDNFGHPVGWNEAQLSAPSHQPQSQQAQVQQAFQPAQLQIQQLQQAGFLTAQQAQQMLQQSLNQAVQQVYQANRNDMLLFRNIDQLRAEDKFKDLAKYDSPLSKKTAEVLQKNLWGKPLDEKSNDWTKWQYTNPEILRHAVQIARVELMDEQQASQAAQASGQANQNGAGLSVAPPSGGTGSPTPTGGQPDVEKMVKEGKGAELNELLKTQTEQNMRELGVIAA